MNEKSRKEVNINQFETNSQEGISGNDSQTITLRDGRKLGYAEYGGSSAKSIFYFHGFPGSRLEGAMVEDKLMQSNIRLIAIDRPGMGLSDFQEDRSILDCSDDVLELADYLGIKKFSVLGVSGGGPYALACAYKISTKVLTSCAVVSGSGPYYLTKEGMSKKNKLLLFMAKHLSWTIRGLIWFKLSRNIRNKEWWDNIYTKQGNELSEPDKQVINDPKIREAIVEKTIEAFCQGSKGLVHDFNLYSKPWGFNLDDIPSEAKTFLFHGELDKNVPVLIVQYMSERISNCITNIYPNEAHLSTFINKFDDIVEKVSAGLEIDL